MQSFSFIFFLSLVIELSSGADIIASMQFIIKGETLVSPGQRFELGFFSPGNSRNLYLGVWYKKLPGTIVWVANRENPLTDSYGALTLAENGNLTITDQNNHTVWSSNSSGAEMPIAQLLESGNFVVREKTNTNTESYIWQSFDFPSDTQLPGMKMGWNFKTGLNRVLTSWKNATDPSRGEFTYTFDNLGLPQLVFRKGSEKKFRTGLWNGQRFSGAVTNINPVFKPSIVYNKDELYYRYEATDNSVVTRVTLTESGSVQRLLLNEGSGEWSVMYSIPNDLCDVYAQCGANGICKISKRPICECLKGFVPKHQKEWEVLNWTGGCVRRIPMTCEKGEGFLKVEGVKLPDLVQFRLNESMGLNECEAECLKNCSCMAYANSDIRNGGTGCLMWFDDLIDIREFIDEKGEQDVYLREAASELDKLGDSSPKKMRLLIISITCGMLVLGLACCFTVWKNRTKKRGKLTNEVMEMPLFDFASILRSTNNFSSTNKIGEGGFGPVYKGELLLGQEIAVKRLSNSSSQGLEEFKNEVIMISKLQHRNLVRILGCCIEREERMLIYEYMPNKSLDYFIFDQNGRASLDWQKRFQIVMGIARGLLYLHQDSRLRIVHRDLKPSNILLDGELNPKISDFGIARIFGGDQVEAKTKRVIGTYGYMSPEYAIDGKFSVKSDVFGLGVLMLEILSGQKNRGFSHPDHHHNLLGHVGLAAVE
ncbi:G-type lectin S-receptor-like serine/threonine-protein kinase At4g27290 isoform X2 [Castanea sativa]|uniref:G-type lectin S-receptor-like serine/threonine-protein kinase At4g27290 isoform X2 n=1 Tax=Castanea sativa TaxID=21020 RepID=UPI003F64D36F